MSRFKDIYVTDHDYKSEALAWQIRAENAEKAPEDAQSHFGLYAEGTPNDDGVFCNDEVYFLARDVPNLHAYLWEKQGRKNV